MDPDKSPARGPERRPDGSDTAGVARWAGIDHVQLAIPVGDEEVARRFYVGVLGLVERPKPERLAARGGAWFEAGATRVHVGVDEAFVPARKAHPALLVRDHTSDPFGNRIELVDFVEAAGT